MAANDIRRLVYTSRQLNTLPDHPLTVFNCVVLCSISKMDMVVEEMKRCYDNVDRAYWNNPFMSSSGNILFNVASITTFTLINITGVSLGMLSSVGGIVIGHFSVDGKLKPNHFIFRQPIPNLFQVEEKNSTNPPSDLFKVLVETFSFTGQTVLDSMTEGKTNSIQCTTRTYYWSQSVK